MSQLRRRKMQESSERIETLSTAWRDAMNEFGYTHCSMGQGRQHVLLRRVELPQKRPLMSVLRVN
jgi:hypothetical protein